jgi:hypothetical protein
LAGAFSTDTNQEENPMNAITQLIAIVIVAMIAATLAVVTALVIIGTQPRAAGTHAASFAVSYVERGGHGGHRS